MSTGPRQQKEKSGFTHHKGSLWHRTPFYKGSESAPPFGLIHEREREKVVMLLRCLARHARNKGQHHLTSWRLFHSTNQPGDQPWWEGGTGRLASPEKVTRALPARAAGWKSSLWSELRHTSTTRKTCVSVCMCVREVGFRENYLEGSKMHRGNPMS